MLIWNWWRNEYVQIPRYMPLWNECRITRPLPIDDSGFGDRIPNNIQIHGVAECQFIKRFSIQQYHVLCLFLVVFSSFICSVCSLCYIFHCNKIRLAVWPGAVVWNSLTIVAIKMLFFFYLFVFILFSVVEVRNNVILMCCGIGLLWFVREIMADKETIVLAERTAAGNENAMRWCPFIDPQNNFFSTYSPLNHDFILHVVLLVIRLSASGID